MINRFIFLALSSGTVLAGCAVGPDFHRPSTPAMERFSVTNSNVNGDVSESEFWKQIDDDELSGLVEQALYSNLDLSSALARYDSVNSLLRAEKFERLPVIEASAQTGRQKVSVDQSYGYPRSNTTYSVGASASWELDLFGRVRRSIEAQQAETRAAAADFAGLQVLIASEVVSSYVNLRSAQQRLRIAQQNADNQSKILNIFEARLSAGRGTEQERLQIKSQLQTTLSRIPSLQVEIAVQKHRLAVLVGRPPTALDEALDAWHAIPSIPGEIPPGTPADLIRRRPDVAAAEARLHAATARVGVAISDLFPKLNLIGGLGAQAFEDRALFHGSSSTSRVLLGIDWSFLDIGRVRARIAASRADAAGLLAQYQQAVLLALEGTENALVRYGRTRVEADHLQQAARDGEEAERLARLRYQAGVVDLYQVLDATRTRLAAQDAASDGQARCAEAAIMLFKELAGGWPEREPAKTAVAVTEHDRA